LTGRALFSSSDQDEVDHLSQAFRRFKQQFDRGLLVQSGAIIEKSGATLETLLEDISAFRTCKYSRFSDADR
jgi:hypothetical protein